LSTVLRPHHIGVQVLSLPRSLAFYHDLLGLEVVSQGKRRDPYIGEIVGRASLEILVAILRLPGSEVFIELLEYLNVPRQHVDADTVNTGTTHIALEVSDVDALHQYLAAHGVASVSPPVAITAGANKGGKAVYMIDPDGVRVELVERAEATDPNP
jgi:lactoylglutathione lyase